MPSDGCEVGLARGRLIDELPFEHHHNAIREGHQFVEVLADEQDRRSAVAGRHELGVNLRDCADIETRARVGSDQHLHLLRELAGKHGSLNVTAGELGDLCIG